MKKIISQINKTGLYHFPNLLSLTKVEEIKNKLNKVYEIRKSKKSLLVVQIIKFYGVIFLKINLCLI